MLERLGALEESEQLLARAEELAAEIQLHREWWKLKIHRALVVLEREKPQEALQHWRAARAWLLENGKATEIERAQADLRSTSRRLNLLTDESWD